MTAPRPHRLVLNQELVQCFAAYLNRGPTGWRDWGIFHGSLAEGRWNDAAPWGVDGVGFNTIERELAKLFDQMTPSQRRRLRKRAELISGEEIAAAKRALARRMTEAANGLRK